MKKIPTPTAAFIVMASLMLLLCLSGCESYALRGTVVEGAIPQVIVVDKSDPRLVKTGLRDARIDVTIDPRAIRPKRQPPIMSVHDGRFEVPISESGAGFLEYDAKLVVQHEGFMHIEKTLKLPGNDKRLLIIMKPGQDNYKPETDVVNESIREGQRLDMLPRN